MEDRLLAHLKVVIVSKMRRNEPFLLSWDVPPLEGAGRKSIWMHPAIPLQFDFAGSRSPSLNGAWIDQMMRASISNEGLRLMPEPTDT